MTPSRIVSGGQTGVDQAALDVAIELGIEHGGWCPAGRLSERGPIPAMYQLQENGVKNYPARTRQNVVDSDATLILHHQHVGEGTILTKRMCVKAKKPYLMLDVQRPDAAEVIREWISNVKPATLNVAGSRASSSPGIGELTRELLRTVFGKANTEKP